MWTRARVSAAVDTGCLERSRVQEGGTAMLVKTHVKASVFAWED